MYTDLIKAQKEIESVDKDGKNPFFNSDYTSLNATIQACKEVLNRNNFVVLQPMDSDEHGVYVCTTLFHASGQSISSRMRIEPAKDNDPQAQGSAITYARRYSLKSLLCMSDNDDDGEKAMSRTSTKSTSSTKQANHLVCPKHGNTIKSSRGNDGLPWVRCTHNDNGNWCKEKPVPAKGKTMTPDQYYK